MQLLNDEDADQFATTPPEPARALPLLTRVTRTVRALVGPAELAFLVGVGLLAWGLGAIWFPLAPASVGAVLVGMAVWGAARAGIGGDEPLAFALPLAGRLRPEAILRPAGGLEAVGFGGRPEGMAIVSYLEKERATG